MGICDPSQACKYHPFHNQKQGVCPSCLSEKLSQVYAGKDPYSKKANNSLMVVYSSSGSSSTHMSPVHRHGRRQHQRNGSEIIGGSLSYKVGGGDYNGLRKSRSVAFVTRNVVSGDGGCKGVAVGKCKKRGFWSKLLHLNGKKDQVMMHPVTMNVKERLY